MCRGFVRCGGVLNLFCNYSASFNANTAIHRTVCLQRRCDVFGELFFKQVALLLHGGKFVVKVVDLLLLRHDEREQNEQ